ncbi:hypothetical protein H2200_007358 [Cladophialophora chaetospira]|uniref:Luciferase domain-containing protein n=1 Tax=Cladophialophora chaetospira TaxID=386627 RepID=A0AA38X7M9_9EURO|nr:hypothetical protein H2200_007358 [Cladophialophora chaetospira]
MDIYHFQTLPNVSNPQILASSSSHSLISTLLYIALILAFSSIIYWCVQDYHFFLSLGRGGPQYNLIGWFKVHIIVRPFTLAQEDLTLTDDYPYDGARKEILSLPIRQGERPLIRGIAPQRQFTQRPGPGMQKRILDLFSSFVEANPQLLEQRLSCAEKCSLALFAHPLLMAKPERLPEIAPIFKGELGHVHGESSLHLYFSPADARVIIEKGWAGRHRISRTQPWWYGGIKNMWGIGNSFLIVYAPRSEEELDVLKTLITASAMWMTGEQQIVKP